MTEVEKTVEKNFTPNKGEIKGKTKYRKSRDKCRVIRVPNQQDTIKEAEIPMRKTKTPTVKTTRGGPDSIKKYTIVLDEDKETKGRLATLKPLQVREASSLSIQHRNAQEITSVSISVKSRKEVETYIVVYNHTIRRHITNKLRMIDVHARMRVNFFVLEKMVELLELDDTTPEHILDDLR